jgi:predicted Zn-dependent protease
MTNRSRSQQPALSKVCAVLLVLFLVVPQLTEARVQPTHGFDLFSTQEEVQAGEQASADASKQLPLLSESDPITQYIKRLGATLAAHAPGQKWPYNFHVVRQKEINAFAMPGGPVYVNLGTIQAADNEAEIAAVMAHEISHVVQRHSTRAATKQMEAQIPLSIVGGFFGKGIGGQLAQLGIQFGAGSYFLRNSRQAEKEADLLGTDILYDTGYNPRWMAEFFRKLEQQGGTRTAQFLSDHPNPGNRYEYVSREVATLPPKGYLPDSSREFAQIKQRAMGLQAMVEPEIQRRHEALGDSTFAARHRITAGREQERDGVRRRAGLRADRRAPLTTISCLPS